MATGAIASLLVMAGFVMDLVFQFRERCRVQRAADAAALAAARELSDRYQPLASGDEGLTDSVRKAALAAAADAVLGVPQLFSGTDAYAPAGEVVIGRLEATPEGQRIFKPERPARCNAVQVRLRQTSPAPSGERRRTASFFGKYQMNVTAQATAAFCDNLRGFCMQDDLDKCSLLPLAVDERTWQAWLDGAGEDAWSCVRTGGPVAAGPDGVREFVGSANNDDCNLGTVLVGGPASDAADLWCQVRYGPSWEDFAAYGGELSLSEAGGTLGLPGRSRIDTGTQAALADVVGQPRTIMLYRDASPRADGMHYTIVGFVGVQLVNCSASGNGCQLRFQPSVVIDSTALAGQGRQHSWYVRQPVRIAR